MAFRQRPINSVPQLHFQKEWLKVVTFRRILKMFNNPVIIGLAWSHGLCYTVFPYIDVLKHFHFCFINTVVHMYSWKSSTSITALGPYHPSGLNQSKSHLGLFILKLKETYMLTYGFTILFWVTARTGLHVLVIKKISFLILSSVHCIAALCLKHCCSFCLFKPRLLSSQSYLIGQLTHA